ncbi:glutamate--tRNA ligase [Candidatus Saccharibacteria bacterium RIFCSPHIGHO2_01_FULL_45_15]|nr:MAG: glutamate--tRNA ligase [Candidatus Saccharibacteria bacterium RIFCSPHIGHO2_01_FULL_45_15]OGL28544.1 MAG: glutamate--tRNA ligase [Candidatus Saccharibacteria bacterium RIFCSPHIGHO2_02_FULL_46_12]OGL32113.1 MAG: glutamate--tRNA ligase [Candidatus Saccharibacteria bacterium RIFCSPHIGHO2_12_FULL_44_22]
MTTIRTRFAPSPTGFMHVGGVRTALFAWFIAQQSSGTFILRIEDTDKVREVEGSITQIENSLRWLGIDWQEGIDKGGTFGPYLQSKRLAIYKEWAQKLIDQGRAYADPYSKDELEAFRVQAKMNKQPFLYRRHRPENPPEWDGSQPLRFKSDPKPYTWTDAVMGDLSTGADAIDDFILIKSDGFPTYNFCHIIDDMLMEITHVLRSQEFISSTPKFLNLYEALQIQRPILGTLPYVMAIDGKKKLGKRDGAKDILEYGSEGFLPEAMMNFLATLGWNDGTEQEVFTVHEMIEKFSLDRVQRSPARFDEQRLLWLNGQHIRLLSLDDLYVRVTDFWPASAKDADEIYKKQVLALVQDRLKTLKDLPIITDYFFQSPVPNWLMADDNKQLRKLNRQEQSELLSQTMKAIEQVKDFTTDNIQSALNQLLITTGQKPGILFSLIRLAVSWAPFSPALNDTLATIGRGETLTRLQTAIDAA